VLKLEDEKLPSSAVTVCIVLASRIVQVMLSPGLIVTL